jgi:hypothetical protein
VVESIHNARDQENKSADILINLPRDTAPSELHPPTCNPLPHHPLFLTYGVGANSATLAQRAEQVPKALLQAMIDAGAEAPSVAPQV